MIGARVKIKNIENPQFEDEYETVITDMGIYGGDLWISCKRPGEDTLSEEFQAMGVSKWIDLESGWEVEITDVV